MSDRAGAVLRELLQDGIQRLASSPARAGSARADARELLSRLLGISLAALSAADAPAPDATSLATWERWLSRRLAGEPVQYITGRAAFRSLDLAVDRRVLIPRPETEGLVEAVLETLKLERQRWPHPRVLDLGTGSGAIALAIASEWPAARVTATDASAAALQVARENAASLGLTDRVRIEHGDWFAAPGAEQRFEVVVSNPPYIAEGERAGLPEDVREFEPAAALYSGSSGTEALREIIDEAPRHLVACGLLALELAENRAREVLSWLEGAQDWERAELRFDLAGQPRVLEARRARGPAIAPEQWIEQQPQG
jgi:release factor glutamine methyltransferase